MKAKIFLLTGVLFGVLVGVAGAHPPSDIKISYDPQTKMLTAVIEHGVSNPVTHYIKKVDVSLNGKEILQHEISREDNNQTQTVIYLIPDANPGDTLSVEGYCSISGNLTRKITVPGK